MLSHDNIGLLSRLFLKKIDWNPKHLIAWRHIRFEDNNKDKDKKTYKDVMIYLARRNDTKELVYDMFSTDNPDKLARYGTIRPNSKHKTYYGTICDVNSKFAKEHKNEVKEDYWKGNINVSIRLIMELYVMLIVSLLRNIRMMLRKNIGKVIHN